MMNMMKVGESSPAPFFPRGVKLNNPSKKIGITYVSLDLGVVEGTDQKTGEVYKAITMCFIPQTTPSILELAKEHKLAYLEIHGERLVALHIHQFVLDFILKSQGLNGKDDEGITRFLIADSDGKILGDIEQEENYDLKPQNDEEYAKTVEEAEKTFNLQSEYKHLKRFVKEREQQNQKKSGRCIIS